jgi:CNT family concentrative nucleoside transporter
MQRFTGLIGLAVILGVAFLFSSNRRAVQPRIVLWGLGLQFSFAFLVLKTPLAEAFTALSNGINHVLGYASEGSKFVFGNNLGGADGGFGVILAFQVLPIIIFIASLFSVLYYLGVMQWFVRGMAVAMQKVMRTSGAETTSVAASIFMGHTEAPLTIRPFLAGLTESELFTIMTSGMAHISGSVMAAYVLIAHVEIRHLLTAVIMTCPGTLMLAKILVPETSKPETSGEVKIEIERPGVNIIDAAARGAGDGLMLALNVGAMLIAFIGLIAMVNGILGWAWPGLTMQVVLGKLFAPVAWMLGVAWNDAAPVGNLLGTRVILNEFVAYSDLGQIYQNLNPRSVVIATYALCGFANIASIAMQVGGIGALAPSRKSDIARLGMKAMAAGTMANFMTAAIAGMLL